MTAAPTDALHAPPTAVGGAGLRRSQRPAGPLAGVAAAAALATREWVRFFRQRHRVVAAVATPLLLWLLLGLGLRDAFGPGVLGGEGGEGGAAAAGSLGFYYPGAVVLMVLFTSIFTCISVIEDRREGFLQGVLASRAPRAAIAGGKIAGGAAIALVQGLALLALGVLVFPVSGGAGLASAVAALAVLSVMLTALGLWFAWPMDSTAGFHGVMNLVLMPMWLLSGGLFPAATAAEPLRWAMRCNPLAHGHALFASGFSGEANALAPAWVSWAVLLGGTAALLALATLRVVQPVKEPS